MSPGKRCSHGVFNDCPDCRAERGRRERIASTLLAGMLGHSDMAVTLPGGAGNSMLNAADTAIELADYLIRQLDEGKDLPS